MGETSNSGEMTRREWIEQGRQRYDARAWDDAFIALAEADKLEALEEVDDLLKLALSAALTGRHDANIATLDRAYQQSLTNHDEEGAAFIAFHAAMRLLMSGERARGSAWMGRSQRIADGLQEPCAAHAFLKLAHAERAIGDGELQAALEAADEGVRLGERVRDADAVAYGRFIKGNVYVRMERMDEAMAMLDEAMLSASSGALTPPFTGIIYCSVIACCQRIFAFERSREWTRLLSEWCDSQPQLLTFTGSCRVHRAEILELGGAWSEADHEAQRCVDRFTGVAGADIVGSARYQQAEIHRLRGELAKAELAYKEASQEGRDPQPGLSLLRLAQGDAEVAVAAMRRVLSATRDPLQRLRYLPAAQEILLHVGAIDEARAVHDELQVAAQRYRGEALAAVAAQARGMLLLVEGEPARALEPLRQALSVWLRLDAPYIVARLRVCIARACDALGDPEGAAMERSAARQTFEQLGARSDLIALDAPTSPQSTAATCGLTPRELEVLKLVAAGKTNKVIARELFVSEKTIDRHVSNLFDKLDVNSRAAATAYAYEHKLV